MEWHQIIINIVFPLIGLIGGGVGIFFWRENKELKRKEVEKAAIENELTQAEAWKSLFESEHAKCERKSEEKRALYAERDSLKEQLNKARFKVEQLCWYHCTVNGCKRRQPPHRFDGDGNEIQADIYDEKNDIVPPSEGPAAALKKEATS